MELFLYPRASENPTTVRMWLGVYAPSLPDPAGITWTLNGAPVVPRVVSAMRSVRSATMLTAQEKERMFSGVFEFTGLHPGTRYNIGVRVGNRQTEHRTATLPAKLESLGSDWFSVLLVSCFDYHNYAGSNTFTNLLRLMAGPGYTPHLTLFMGDQVYLDLPTFQNFPQDAAWLAKKFEDDYVRNWKQSAANDYAALLGAAPAVLMPDDHEFWNNYPFASPFIGNTHSAQGRTRWGDGAKAMVAGFQAHDPAAPGKAVRIDVQPISFFIADTRSSRKDDKTGLLSEDEQKQMETWADDVIRDKLLAVFVSGQSMFSPPKGEFGGSIADFELSNFDGDFGWIVEVLQRIMNAGGTVLCITGDVHWGRILRVKDKTSGRNPLYEIITSPAALVSTPGSDQLKQLGGFFGGLFGKRNPFPRHSTPDVPDESFVAEKLIGKYSGVDILHNQVGDQIALLSFRRYGGGIDMRVTYFPVSNDHTVLHTCRHEQLFEKFFTV